MQLTIPKDIFEHNYKSKTMKKLCAYLLLTGLLVGCSNSKESQSGPSVEDTATFNSHIESWKEKVINGFSSEDPEKVMSLFADSLKWNNPEALMNTNKTKEDLTAAVNFYIGSFDNINFTEDVYYGGSLYSSEETSASPDGMRIYGNWSFKDPESGSDVSYKWMGVVMFNEDGQIHQFADWFDVSSIPAQIAGSYAR